MYSGGGQGYRKLGSSKAEFVTPFSEADEETMEMKESNDENLYRVCGMGS
jgi:hypothetical protein